jgi:hypothetical protein
MTDINAKQQNKNSLPRWIERTLQGLTFWIGHRHALYDDYPLPEGAVVAEACNLIQANLEPNKKLLCECTYGKLVSPGMSRKGFNKNARADLVIIDKGVRKKIHKSSNLAELAQIVIEVKRGSSSIKKAADDLRRLSVLKSMNPKVRAMLFVVSESKLPKEFVSEKGYARRKIVINKEDKINALHCSVRRVCKASSSFKGQVSAHYACAIEVL